MRDDVHLQPTPRAAVLLYSAGLDSHILYRLARPQHLVRFDRAGSAAADVAERAAIDRLQQHGALRDAQVVTSTTFDFTGFTPFPKKHIVPYRNVFFALAASTIAPDVLMATTLGDDARDKDHVFGTLTSALATYVMNHHDYVPGARVTIHQPVMHMTKAELVRAYLRDGHDPQELALTTSCYAGDDCGVCHPCFRRYIALAINGIDGIMRWRQDPLTGVVARREHLRVRLGGSDGRDDETRGAVEDAEIRTVMDERAGQP